MSEPINSYRDLRVWQESMGLAEACYALTRAFPRDETFGLSSQIKRSAASVPATLRRATDWKTRARSFEVCGLRKAR